MPKYGFALKSKNITTTKQKYKHKNPSQYQNWNRGPLAPQSVSCVTYGQYINGQRYGSKHI